MYRSCCRSVNLNLHHFSLNDLCLLSIQKHMHRLKQHITMKHVLFLLFQPGKLCVTAGPLTWFGLRWLCGRLGSGPLSCSSPERRSHFLPSQWKACPDQVTERYLHGHTKNTFTDRCTARKSSEICWNVLHHQVNRDSWCCPYKVQDI